MYVGAEAASAADAGRLARESLVRMVGRLPPEPSIVDCDGQQGVVDQCGSDRELVDPCPGAEEEPAEALTALHWTRTGAPRFPSGCRGRHPGGELVLSHRLSARAVGNVPLGGLQTDYVVNGSFRSLA